MSSVTVLQEEILLLFEWMIEWFLMVFKLIILINY